MHPCPHCACHVRLADRDCPHCGRALSGRPALARTLAAAALSLTLGGEACVGNKNVDYGNTITDTLTDETTEPTETGDTGTDTGAQR